MKNLIRLPVFCFLLVMISTVAFAQGDFNRKQFYSAMQGEDLNAIDKQLAVLKDAKLSEKKAFEGALTAKKAGLVKGANKKLKYFKSGATDLQSAIGADQDNTEYRFLRLMIQEHAPKIVNYDGDLDKDSKFIREHYSKLSPELKEIVKNYSKQSKFLKPDDLN